MIIRHGKRFIRPGGFTTTHLFHGWPTYTAGSCFYIGRHYVNEAMSDEHSYLIKRFRFSIRFHTLVH